MRVLSLAACVCLASIAFGACGSDDNDTSEEGPSTGRTGSDAAIGSVDAGTSIDASTRADATVGDARVDARVDASADAGRPSTLPKQSTGGWFAYTTDGKVSPEPRLAGRATAEALGDGMVVSMMVTGLPPSRDFGAHLHKLPCSQMMAGGHYQDRRGGANDPAFANPENEIWLDFSTTPAGGGEASAAVGWVPRVGEAASIVIHENPTGDGGIAGAKLFCTDIAF